jgi:succinate dehydrogenase / fumarate reductase cytochrome b subunit
MSTTVSDAGTTTPQVVVPELPPAFQVSKRESKSLPNWALKVAMAITGTFGALFLALHLVGNLKVYTGAEHFNDYALWLRHMGEPLIPANGVIWILRIGLVVCLLVHVTCAALIWTRGRAARGKFPAKRNNGFRSLGATMMPFTGCALLAFIIFHIMDLTLGTQPIATSGFQEQTETAAFAYQNLVAGFTRPWAAAIYVTMMGLLSIHLAHGLFTVVSDLGAVGKRLRAIFIAIGGFIALAILLGNASIPLAVQLGVLK